MDFVTSLRTVLPELDVTDAKLRSIISSDMTLETKALDILSHHFQKKRSEVVELDSLADTVLAIKTLIPSVSRSYILEQLENFKDMPNCKEIVLRIIVNKKHKKHKKATHSGVKRSKMIVQLADLSKPAKHRKLTKVSSCQMSSNPNKPEESVYVKKITLSQPDVNVNTMPTPTIPEDNDILTAGKTTTHPNKSLVQTFKQNNALITIMKEYCTESTNQEENDVNSNARPGDTVTPSWTTTGQIDEIKTTEEDGPSTSKEGTSSRLNFATENAIKDDEKTGIDYIKEVLSRMEQDQEQKPSHFLYDQQVTKESVPPLAQNSRTLLVPFPLIRERDSYNVDSAPVTNIDGAPSTTVSEDLLQWKPDDVKMNQHSPNAIQDNSLDAVPVAQNTLFSAFPLVRERDSYNIDSASATTVSEDLLQWRPKDVTMNQHSPNGLQNNSLDAVKDQMFTNYVSSAAKVNRKFTTVPYLRQSKMAPGVNHCSGSNQKYPNYLVTTKTNDDQHQPMLQYRNYNHPAASTQIVHPLTGTEKFDLLQCLHEITNSPLNVIEKECRKLNLPLWLRPEALQLQLVIDNLLTNKISSEGSTDEDYSDEVEDLYGMSDQLNEMHKSRSELDLERNDTSDEKPAKITKLVASSTVTSQSLLPPVFSEKKTTETISNDVLPSSSVNTQLVNYLCGIFPDASRDYIKGLCKNKEMSNEVLDDLTTVILGTNGAYPKRAPVVVEPEVVPKNQLEILKEFLPDADPDYLSMMCDKFEGKPDMVKSFINEAMERKNYPTLKEYQRRQQLSAQQKQYTEEFSVENFIKLIPDPHTFFSDPQRSIKMDILSSHYALVFLRNRFNKLPVRVIQSTFNKNSENVYKTVKELDNLMTQKHLVMRSTRKPIVMPNSIQNIPLLQEIAYFTHEKAINQYLQEIKNKEEAERQEALSKGLMKTCDCCYDDSVLPKDIFTCENGCPFCKLCIVKSTEVRFGEGKLDFPCLMDCSSHFTLQTLQSVLPPKLFSKLAQKKAVEEIKSAGIEELETCPFCDFATIPAEGYNIFSCLNPECMKESCRLCKEPSHIPLRCDEIEKDEDVRARTFVENKMTEALLRKCWKCGIKFFKEEGCNKMTCSCGAKMCYICGSRVTDYRHFNGNGGERFDLCPLYSDTNVVNKENVLRGAAEAKAEIGNKALKHDPTADLQRHYKERAKKVPQPHAMIDPHQRAGAVVMGAREAIVRLGQLRPHNQF